MEASRHYGDLQVGVLREGHVADEEALEATWHDGAVHVELGAPQALEVFGAAHRAPPWNLELCLVHAVDREGARPVRNGHVNVYTIEAAPCKVVHTRRHSAVEQDPVDVDAPGLGHPLALFVGARRTPPFAQEDTRGAL